MILAHKITDKTTSLEVALRVRFSAKASIIVNNSVRDVETMRAEEGSSLVRHGEQNRLGGISIINFMSHFHVRHVRHSDFLILLIGVWSGRRVNNGAHGGGKGQREVHRLGPLSVFVTTVVINITAESDATRRKLGRHCGRFGK